MWSTECSRRLGLDCVYEWRGRFWTYARAYVFGCFGHFSDMTVSDGSDYFQVLSGRSVRMVRFGQVGHGP